MPLGPTNGVCKTLNLAVPTETRGRRQRIEQVLCNNTGWSLVFHKPDSRFHQPAFSLLACRATMTAALVVRGTGSIQDVITDIQAMPVAFPAPRGGDAVSGERCKTGCYKQTHGGRVCMPQKRA